MFAIEVMREAIRTFVSLPVASRSYVAAVGLSALGVLCLGVWFMIGLLGSGGQTLCETSGIVRYQGIPVAIGQIAFEPLDARRSAGSAVPIRDGEFVVPTAIGLRPSSTYRLVVSAYRLVSEAPVTDKPSNTRNQRSKSQDAAEEYVQFIPRKYNVDSELLFEATRSRLRDGLVLELD